MSEKIHNAVRDKYGAVATSGLSSDHAGVHAVAQAFGYSTEELASIPAEANMGLSCGNPTATANLRAGEVVVDLGCGGGLDVFLAAAKVGPTGKAIGIDMTTEMLELARKNAAQGRNGQPITNVEFYQATIDKLPLPDASVDCVISNCVINLAADKPAVFREIARILKPGGRLAASDIALKQALPEELGQDLMAYVGCIAGAIPVDDYRQQLLNAGFAAVEVVDTRADLNAYAQVENQAGCCTPTPQSTKTPQSTTAPQSTADVREACCGSSSATGLQVVELGCCSPPPASDSLHARLLELLGKYDVNEYAASVRVFAVKP